MAATVKKAECLLNREDDSLPYAYFNPETEGKLTWMCGEDAEGKITSVFCYDRGSSKDKQCQYLHSIEEARIIRTELIKSGWKKVVPPEITVTYPGQKDPQPLTRKQKRSLKRKVQQLNRRNPFE
jgi:hypothetical protein